MPDKTAAKRAVVYGVAAVHDSYLVTPLLAKRAQCGWVLEVLGGYGRRGGSSAGASFGCPSTDGEYFACPSIDGVYGGRVLCLSRRVWADD